MTLEELYLIEKDRIKILSLHYARMYKAEREDLLQEGALAVVETHNNYADRLDDEELLKVSHRIVNRKIYKYARNEYRHKVSETQSNATEKD